MTGDDKHTQFDRRGNDQPTGILDVLLAELEADDGERAAALRWTLDIDGNATEKQLETLQNELMSLRAEVNQLSAADSERETSIENQLKPRLLTLERRLGELDDELTSVRAEMRGLRSEFTDVRNSLERAETGAEDAPEVDAIAGDVAELERRVADAFQAVTSNLENDLESMQETVRADLQSMKRRLRALEVESRSDPQRRDGRSPDDEVRRY